MQVQDVYSNALSQSTGISQLDLFKSQKTEQEQTLPISWGSDKVTISDEARAAMQAANKEKEQSTEEESLGTGAGAEFAAYMDKSKSKAQSPNPEERLKDLQDKLQSLEGQLSGMVKDGSKPGQDSKTEMITAQINTVMQEIAELMTQMAADKKSA